MEYRLIADSAAAYENYADEENYAKVVSEADTEAFDYSLNIPLYVRDGVCAEPALSVEECVDDWIAQSMNSMDSIEQSKKMISGAGEQDGEG